MKITLGSWVVLALGFSVVSAFAHEGHGSTVPAKFADFEKLTFVQMKALPDFKWPLEKVATAADLEKKTETELVLLRNSIYAQYGFGFGQKALANYFLSRSWYHKNAEAADLDKVSKEARTSVAVFLKAQATVVGGTRGVASGDEHQLNQIAYNLFRMGFCTYEVNGDSRAGMVVFEPAGVAKVFHSRASQAPLYDYAYDEYAKPDMLNFGSTLLIEAKWGVEIVGKKGIVTITYPQDTVDRIKDYDGKPILDTKKREVLTVNLGNGDFAPNMYPWVKTRRCTMLKLK